jgi:formylmethanofuran dehydrogenase subunit E
MSDNLSLEACVERARAFHGDVCAGIALGTRMAMAGLRAIDIVDPRGKDRKDLMVFVEIDRCATDAIMAITGCQPGKRTMKIYDYGKMAATFLNLKTGKAVRLTVKETANGTSRDDKPGGGENQADLFLALPEEDLLVIDEVTVDVRPQDMPGKPLRVVLCDGCGERIMDMRDRQEDGKTLCKPCAAKKSYYTGVLK